MGKLTQAELVGRLASGIDSLTAELVTIAVFSEKKEVIKQKLGEIEEFIRENPDLSTAELKTLQEALIKLGTTPFIKEGIEGKPAVSLRELGDKAADRKQETSPSIAKSMHYCADFARKAAELRIIMDARLNGNTGFKFGRPLGSSFGNTVSITTKEGREIILKTSNDEMMTEEDGRENCYASDAIEIPREFVGSMFGAYEKNMATTAFQTIFSTHNAPKVLAESFAAEDEYGNACIGTEKVEGKTVLQAQYDSSLSSNNANYLKSATWIQISDCFLGQVDRHAGNVIVGSNGNITAIDHDFAFPTNPPRAFAGKIPSQLTRFSKNAENKHFNNSVDDISTQNFAFPPVIDTDMYNAIMEMTSETGLTELEQQYRDCGLTKAEIEPALTRARAIRERAIEMHDAGQCIDPAEWNLPATTDQLTKENSYAKMWVQMADNLRQPKAK